MEGSGYGPHFSAVRIEVFPERDGNYIVDAANSLVSYNLSE